MKPDKKKLLNNLENNTFCRVKRSSVHGVGLFAIRDIDEGVNPFVKVNPVGPLIVELDEEEIEKLPDEIKSYIKDFFAKDENGKYPVLSNGMNGLDITFFLNHSNNPNVTADDDYVGLDTYSPYKTTRKIKKGEELTQNYKEMFKDLKQFGINEES